MGVVSGFGADRGGEQQQVAMTSSTYVNSTGHRLSFGIGGVRDLNPKEQLVPALERTVRYQDVLPDRSRPEDRPALRFHFAALFSSENTTIRDLACAPP